MRGKKIDTEYVAKFIDKCVINNKTSVADICQEANDLIKNIDEKIKEAELLKKRRLKILDVLIALSFEKDRSKDKLLLKFSSIQNIEIAVQISSLLEKSIYNKETIIKIIDNPAASNIIDQLYYLNVIGINQSNLYRESNYPIFYTFIKVLK